MKPSLQVLATESPEGNTLGPCCSSQGFAAKPHSTHAQVSGSSFSPVQKYCASCWGRVANWTTVLNTAGSVQVCSGQGSSHACHLVTNMGTVMFMLQWRKAHTHMLGGQCLGCSPYTPALLWLLKHAQTSPHRPLLTSLRAFSVAASAPADEQSRPRPCHSVQAERGEVMYGQVEVMGQGTGKEKVRQRLGYLKQHGTQNGMHLDEGTFPAYFPHTVFSTPTCALLSSASSPSLRWLGGGWQLRGRGEGCNSMGLPHLVHSSSSNTTALCHIMWHSSNPRNEKSSPQHGASEKIAKMMCMRHTPASFPSQHPRVHTSTLSTQQSPALPHRSMARSGKTVEMMRATLMLARSMYSSTSWFASCCTYWPHDTCGTAARARVQRGLGFVAMVAVSGLTAPPVPRIDTRTALTHTKLTAHTLLFAHRVAVLVQPKREPHVVQPQGAPGEAGGPQVARDAVQGQAVADDLQFAGG